MKFSRFVTTPDSTPLHSSELAGKGAPAPQSFAERRQLETQRQIVGGYQRSLVGGAYGGRGQIRPAQRPVSPNTDTSASRQQIVPEVQSFKEPPVRGYDPYS